MSLTQIHWQWIRKGKTIKTEMRAQREINNNDEMREFFEETSRDHPLPDGAIWLACDERSKHFVWTKA